MEKNLKYIEIVDSIENESEYVKKCFTAMRMIAANPYLIKNTENNDSPVLERNYILSMVYCMGKSDYLRSETGFQFKSCSRLIGGETIKLISANDQKMERTWKDLNFSIKANQIESIPDLVIHDSHNPNSGNSDKGQFLVLEAKTTRRLGEHYFMRDFFKLNLYLSRLHFQNAVSLVINKPVSKIDDYIGTYKKKNYYWCDEVKSKLRLFIQENDTPEMYKLKSDSSIE